MENMIGKKDKYCFPAVFSHAPGEEISVVFPDLNAATQGANDQDALASAQELLGTVLLGLEEDGIEIPEPTPLDKINLDKNEHTSLVEVFMPSLRQAASMKAISRTVTVPAWLNTLAIEHNINFSQTLQLALKQQLNVL